MKYIVATLYEHVMRQKKPGESSNTIVRIDGFEDIRIYEQFCKKIKEYCDNQKIQLIAKLSYPKYLEFKETGDKTALLSMEQNNWVDFDDSMTRHRNDLSKEGENLLIILMGTEVTDDTGGTHDFYYLNPNRLEENLRDKYSKVFNNQQWDEEEAKCIDKLFKWLFELVPINIYKLSCIADEWQDVDNISMFIEYFFKHLPEWKLCMKVEKLPSLRTIVNSKRNLLKTNYEFIERSKFKSLGNKSFDKIRENMERYDGEFAHGYEGWAYQSIQSYDEYKSVLLDFILGHNTNELRNKLMGVDFTITEEILSLKPDRETELKEKSKRVYGDPLNAMLQALFRALLSVSDVHAISEIIFDFSVAKLIYQASAAEDEEKDDSLADIFEEICYKAGGVIDYIAARDWSVGSNEVLIKASPENFFTPSLAQEHVNDGRVISLGASKKHNIIEFSVNIKDSAENNLENIEFEWRFTNEELWLFSFSDISKKYRELSENSYSSFLPLGTCKNINEFLYLKSEEEFFDTYDEAEIEYVNLLDEMSKYTMSSADLWKYEFNALGQKFMEVCGEITSKGFYASGEKINEFIDLYNALGKRILQEDKFSPSLKWALRFYIHTFAIEEDDKALAREEEMNACLIPPWHPIILQKLVHQSVFILDGCTQWWHETASSEESLERTSLNKALSELEQLNHLSCIHQAVDIFPMRTGRYFGCLNTFGNFCICGNYGVQENFRMKDVLRKEAVFDDDFTDSEIKRVSLDALMIYDIIEDYTNAFPNKSRELSLTFIDPSELQPVVAAVHKYIDNIKNETNSGEYPLRLTLNILVKPENRGGKSYLSYWVNSFFSQDDNTDIKIYLNEWKTRADVKKLIPLNTDIVFVIDMLSVSDFRFIPRKENIALPPTDCKFPIVFKPIPSAPGSVERQIEITQPQFEAATVHSQVVYYNDHLHEEYKEQSVIKEVRLDTSGHELLDILHQNAYWVVCIDGGMDGALLKNPFDGESKYTIIGFSTGKGHHGQYNLTVTAKESIVAQVQKRFEQRVRSLFRWSEERAKKAAEVCVKEASKLDGVSLLRAVDQGYKNMNEFMAYVLTSSLLKKRKSGEGLNVLLNLDSYRHWFYKDIHNVERECKSRPDFLEINVTIGEDGKLHLDVTVIECKIAKYSNSEERINDAKEQVDSGLKALKQLFMPAEQNKSVRRRYWYAQLYRALTFSLITFSSDLSGYHEFESALKAILDGNFTVEWSGKVMGYWVDMEREDIKYEYADSIEILNIPQKVIQKLLLGDDEAIVEYADVSSVAIDESDEMENEYDNFEDDNSDTAEVINPIENDDIRSVDQAIDVADPIDNKKNDIDKKDDTAVKYRSGIFGKPSPVKAAESNLHEIKVHIGKDNRDNVIYWDFGHPDLSNRHLLITGTSGQGKTYLTGLYSAVKRSKIMSAA
jgi:DNA phosphorothioation-dependent restriction protein DptH